MCLSCSENCSLRSIDVVFHLPQMTHQTLSNSHSMVAAVQEQSYFLHFHLYIACNIVPEAVGMDRHPQPPLQSRNVLCFETWDIVRIPTRSTYFSRLLAASTSSQFLDGHS